MRQSRARPGCATCGLALTYTQGTAPRHSAATALVAVRSPASAPCCTSWAAPEADAFLSWTSPIHFSMAHCRHSLTCRAVRLLDTGHLPTFSSSHTNHAAQPSHAAHSAARVPGCVESGQLNTLLPVIRGCWHLHEAARFPPHHGGVGWRVLGFFQAPAVWGLWPSCSHSAPDQARVALTACKS